MNCKNYYLRLVQISKYTPIYLFLGILYISTNRNLYSNNIPVNVVLLNDKSECYSLPNIDIRTIITYANNLLKPYHIRIIPETVEENNINIYFRKYLFGSILGELFNSTTWNALNSLEKDFKKDVFVQDNIKLLKANYTIRELEDLCQVKYKSYPEYLEFLIQKYLKKFEAVKTYKNNGMYLIKRHRNYSNSFLAWVNSITNQNKYDIIFTNKYILYDSVLLWPIMALSDGLDVGHCYVGTKKINSLNNTVILISYFTLFNEMVLLNNKKLNIMSNQEKLKYIGEFYLTHKILNIIFNLKDEVNRDHDKNCIMNVRLSFRDRNLPINGIICDKCRKKIKTNCGE